MREYLLNIIAGALICGILTSILQDKKYNTIAKLLCSIFMTLALVQPWMHLQIRNISLDNIFDDSQAERIVQEGSAVAKQAMAIAVQEQTAAYICQKASAYDTELSVSVELDRDTQIPVRVEICGAVSPLTKQRLSGWIADELGISKEAQNWVS